jgi:hypothetical protein
MCVFRRMVADGFGESVTEVLGKGVTGDFGQSVTDFRDAPKWR